jgi:hypothetical protein
VAEKVNRAQVTRAGKAPYQPDNYYFKTLYDLGLLGLWMFALFLLGAFRSTTSTADHLEGADRAFADGVVGMIIAVAVASLVSTYFEIFPLDLLFWLLLAVAATLSATRTAGVSDRASNRLAS